MVELRVNDDPSDSQNNWTLKSPATVLLLSDVNLLGGTLSLSPIYFPQPIPFCPAGLLLPVFSKVL